MENTIIKNRVFRIGEKSKEWIILSICLLCTFLFLFSAYEKLIEHERFLNGLVKVKYIGTVAEYVSWSVPILEILVSILLIIPQTQKWGLLGFIVLMGIFTVYILSMWLWAEHLPCHCNLIIDNLSWGEHIWFNIFFIVLGSFALKLKKSNL